MNEQSVVNRVIEALGESLVEGLSELTLGEGFIAGRFVAEAVMVETGLLEKRLPFSEALVQAPQLRSSSIAKLRLRRLRSFRLDDLANTLEGDAYAVTKAPRRTAGFGPRETLYLEGLTLQGAGFKVQTLSEFKGAFEDVLRAQPLNVDQVGISLADRTLHMTSGFKAFLESREVMVESWLAPQLAVDALVRAAALYPVYAKPEQTLATLEQIKGSRVDAYSFEGRIALLELQHAYLKNVGRYKKGPYKLWRKALDLANDSRRFGAANPVKLWVLEQGLDFIDGLNEGFIEKNLPRIMEFFENHSEIMRKVLSFTVKETFDFIKFLDSVAKKDGTQDVYGVVESAEGCFDTLEDGKSKTIELMKAHIVIRDKTLAQRKLTGEALQGVDTQGFTIRELVTASELQREGEEMRHCVGGYARAVEDGRSIIISFRHPEGKLRSTLELKKDGKAYRVVQHRAFANKNPSEKELEIGLEICSLMNSFEEKESSEAA